MLRHRHCIPWLNGLPNPPLVPLSCHPPLGQVVIKLIEHGTGVLGKEKERGRLARVEACVSRMLLHPNIVLTYDACTGRLQPGRLAAKLGRGGGGMGGSSRGGGGRQRFMTVMVQEFCELGTLRDAINRRKHGLAG